MGRAFDGSYVEYVLLPNNQLYPARFNLSYEQLAFLPETYYTAFISMKNLQLKPHQEILVRGATSGVGVAFVNLVKHSFDHVKIWGDN